MNTRYTGASSPSLVQMWMSSSMVATSCRAGLDRARDPGRALAGEARAGTASLGYFDLAARGLPAERRLANLSGGVTDPGFGCWAIPVALAEAALRPAVTTALYERCSTRAAADRTDEAPSTMRLAFVGKVEEP